MRYEHFNMRDHGFAGHLAEPDQGSDRAVIIVMGSEQSQNPLCIVFYEFEFGNELNRTAVVQSYTADDNT